MCENCTHYAAPTARILIVKLDAAGDVLRTTCILHGLHEQYPGCEVTWVTKKGAVPMFEQNPFVHRVLPYESTETILHALVEEFDVMINLDAARESSVLAAAAKAKKKIGFGLDARGDVFAFNPEAEGWLKMGAFDQLKMKNTRSYQDIMLEVCGLKTKNKEIVVRLSDKEKAFADAFAAKNQIDRKKPIIGMNTGASGRWEYKQWMIEGYEALIRKLLDTTDATILLYGGPLEKERNDRLRPIHPTRVVDTGTNNSLREFFALVSLSDVFLTGDTMALHVATALQKKVIAYFGPTSAPEIDSYDGRVTKVTSNLDCLGCYKSRCDFQPHCMNSITVDQMYGAVAARL